MSDLIREELQRVAEVLGGDGPSFVLERPRDQGHGDLATNLAMVLAKELKQKPRDLARRVIEEIKPPLLGHLEDGNRRARLYQLLAGRR